MENRKYVEVLNGDDFTLVSDQIHNLLLESISNYGEGTNSWADQQYSNGQGGFYMPLPFGARFINIDEIIGDRPVYDYLPSSPPIGSFTPLTIVEDIRYSVDDIVNLGAITKGAVLDISAFLKTPSNDEYMIFMYSSGEVCIVNLNDNTYKYLDTNLGAFKNPVYHTVTNSITFFSASKTAIYTYYFDDDSEFASDVYLTTEGVQSRSIGIDDLIYFGTSKTTSLFSYDPSSNEIVEYGSVNNVSGDVYAYAVSGDSTHIYTSLRGPYNVGNYWICALKKADKSKVYYETNSQYKAQNFNLKKTTDNVSYFSINLHTSSIGLPIVTYNLLNGNIVEYSGENQTYQFNGYITFNEVNPALWSSMYNYDVILKDITGQNGGAKLSYKKTEEEDYVTLTLTDVETPERGCSFIVGTENDEIALVAGAYSNIALLDSTGVDVVESMPSASLKDIIKFDNDTYYLSGYANCTWKWDRTKPWNLLQGNPKQVPIHITSAYYHYRLVKKDNYIYVGVNKERTSVGVEIAWINNDTEEVNSTSGTSLSTELKNYYFNDLLLINNNEKLVLVAGRNNPNNKSRIYVWDLTLGVNLNDQTPVKLDFAFNYITPNDALWYGVTDKFLVRDGKNLIVIDLSSGTFSYRSFPTVNTTINTIKRSLYNNKIYIVSNSGSNKYIYELDPSNWDYKQISSSLGTADVGIRTTSISEIGIVYFYGDKSITTIDGIRDSKFVEKLEL